MTVLYAPFNKYYQWTVDRLFESKIIYENMHQIAPQIFLGKPPKPPSKRMATQRVASPPPKKIVAPFGKSCIRL